MVAPKADSHLRSLVGDAHAAGQARRRLGTPPVPLYEGVQVGVPCLALSLRVAPSASSISFVRPPASQFGVVDASNKSLTKWLGKGKSVVLYIGGIAELFLVSQV